MISRGVDRLVTAVMGMRHAVSYSRRSVLRAGAGLVGGFAAGTASHRRAAAAPPPIPDASYDSWPVCSADRPYYCIEALTVDGVDQLETDSPEFTAWVGGTAVSENDPEATQLEWSVSPVIGEMPESALDRDFVLRVRAGRFDQQYMYAIAATFRLEISGDAEAGWVLEYRGRPGLLALADDPADPEQATSTIVQFFGGGNLRNSAATAGLRGFSGYVANNAPGPYGLQWRDGAWLVSMSSPHFLPNGEVAHGSYVAWITGDTIQGLGLTVEQAINGGLSVTRLDGNVTSPVDASITELDGGVLIEIFDITFSRPTIVMKRRGGGKCSPKCRKGRVCKNARCVKKKGKRKRR